MTDTVSNRNKPRIIPSVALCRVALQRGMSIEHVGKHWRIGERLYNPETINALVAAGEAVIVDRKLLRREVTP